MWLRPDTFHHKEHKAKLCEAFVLFVVKRSFELLYNNGHMRLDRLDKTVFIVVAATLVLLGLILLRGDQVGVQVVRSSPAADASNVPTRGQISLAFSEPLITSTLEGRLSLTPEITGDVHWNGNTAFFVPSRALQPDTVYQLIVKAGATSQRGRSLLQDYVMNFRTGQPRMAYLSPVDGASDIYVQTLAGAEGSQTPQRLTTEQFGVRDFAISPDGTRMVYSAKRVADGEMDLWLINADGSGREALLRCDEQVCQAPSWSADGSRVAFERRALVTGAVGKTPGPSRIWVVDVASKQAMPLLDDQQRLGFLPRFAPLGDQLAFYDSTRSAVMVFDVATGQETQLPSVFGDSGAWSPDGNQLVYSELVPVEESRYNQLLRADLARSVITPVLTLSMTNDASAAWAPQGDRIAFGRQVRGGPGGFGAQVWVMNADGSNARALTVDAGFNYGALSWSADGQWLAALQWNLTEPNAIPEIWLIDTQTGNRRRFVGDAWQPLWFP